MLTKQNSNSSVITNTNIKNNINWNTKNSNTTTMMDTYRAGFSGSGAVKRIGTPHAHDVLSGRGGAINSHVGNQHFREWVQVRREAYNLARSKAEKARIATEVMDLVRNQNPPGRFLQRDQSSSSMGVTWWVEVDEAKAMAKTSQALREGAPSIRAAHKDDFQGERRRSRKSKKTAENNTNDNENDASTGGTKRNYQSMQAKPVLSSSTNIPMPPLAPLSMSKSQAMRQLKANVEAAESNAEAEASFAPLMNTSDYENTFNLDRPTKRNRSYYGNMENLYLPKTSSIGTFSVPKEQPQPHIVKPDDIADTPPLEPMPSPVPLSDIPELSPHRAPTIPKRETSFRRVNSLALSDIGTGDNYQEEKWSDLEFVNPFEGEGSDYWTPPGSIPPPVPLRSSLRQASSSKSCNGKNSLGSSELSDLVDGSAPTKLNNPSYSDFAESMKEVYDIVHPGLPGSDANERIPTHLYPFKRSKFSGRSDSESTPQLIL